MYVKLTRKHGLIPFNCCASNQTTAFPYRSATAHTRSHTGV